LNTITNQADFAEVISRGIGNRENLPGSTSLFYEKAIVETENWLSQSIYFFSKERIASHFRKSGSPAYNRDITVKNLSRFPFPSALHQSENPLHQITN